MATPLPNAQLLVNVSNDAWFGASIAPAQHLQIARMRALETGREIIRATNTGISAIITADGEIQARTGLFQGATIHAVVATRTGATPYVALGSTTLVWLFALITVFSTIAYRWRVNRNRPR